ncbi:MAG: thiamine phosphate synthase [Chloroflexi bacterium]|nr:thiamine phosphate synthase [Chloroflexota bacterium]
MITPFIEAHKGALRQSLLLIEAAVKGPIGLTYDLRALRQSLFPDEEDTEAAKLREETAPGPERGLDALAQAAGAIRLLRSLESLDGGWAGRAEKVLARASARLGADLRRQCASQVRGLYVIVDPKATNGRPILEVAAAALRGGARVLQLRDKVNDKGDQLPVARKLAALCRQHNALLFINDHADLAVASGAHGLHVGQHDLPIAEARRVLSPGQLVGCSNALVDEAVASEGLGADYIAVGAIYPTASKEKTRPAGLETLRKVRQIVQTPIVAIGGINESNVEEVIAAGADAVAVISAVVSASDPEASARRLTAKIEAALAPMSSGRKG